MTLHLPRARARVVWALATILLVFALVGAARLRWVADDAFISYRYAQNLAEGRGLVYNDGERVEGFSNFLWTLLLAGSLNLGADPVPVSQALGIVAYAATLALLVACSARAGEGALPLAAAGLALHPHARIFATGGLETALFAFLVTATVAAAVEARTPRAYGLASLLSVLAALTRPDGAIFLLWPLLGAVLEGSGRRRGSLLAAAAAPGAAAYAIYLAWKLHYFGQVLPNTFHAKSAGLASYGQGLLYLRLYFESYWPLAVGLVGAMLLLRPGAHRTRGRWLEPRALLLLGAAVAAYLAFVARVGGDFMFARFVLPVTPLLLLLTEIAVRGLRLPALRLAAGAAVLAALATARLPAELSSLHNPTGIVEERSFYPAERVEEARRAGEELRVALSGTPARVAIFGSQAMLAYYARFPYVLEAHTGLTDRAIARREVGRRGRPGHEKMVGLDYLRERDIDFVFNFGLFRHEAKPSDRIRVGQTTGTIVRHRPDVVRLLADRPGVAFEPASLTGASVDW